MDDRFNTIAGWVLFAGIVGLGLNILSGKYFHAGAPERPETLGYVIEGVEEGTEEAEMTMAAALNMGAFVLLLAYVIALVLGRQSLLPFAKALLPAQAVALSTQSSLASLPAMLDSATRLNLRESTSEFVLPLAVAIFRATSVAMNVAVALYVAAMVGIEVSLPLMIMGGWS